MVGIRQIHQEGWIDWLIKKLRDEQRLTTGLVNSGIWRLELKNE